MADGYVLAIDQAGIKALLKPGSDLDRHLEQIARRTAAFGLQEAPKGPTGQLGRKVVVRRVQGNWTVTWTSSYAIYVIKGTRPHLIVPRRARVLRFEEDGRPVYAMKVKHPGTKPNNFPLRALRRAVR